MDSEKLPRGKQVTQGQRYGKWTVLARAGRRATAGGNRSQSLCQCDCGDITTVLDDSLKSGASTSCGCSRIPTVDGLPVLSLRGETKNLREWAFSAGVPLAIVQDRLKHWKCTYNVALFTPAPRPLELHYVGRVLTLREISKRTGVAYGTLYTRLTDGWTRTRFLSKLPHRPTKKT